MSCEIVYIANDLGGPQFTYSTVLSSSYKRLHGIHYAVQCAYYVISIEFCTNNLYIQYVKMGFKSICATKLEMNELIMGFAVFLHFVRKTIMCDEWKQPQATHLH